MRHITLTMYGKFLECIQRSLTLSADERVIVRGARSDSPPKPTRGHPGLDPESDSHELRPTILSEP